ncbi:iron-sulfur cluster assembly scaffold protein [Emcibacter sp.]|uniref:iron-sulfur cluster assembly scaffold protein n=1 Tax=Emcibacter sp. TaxID=1979954 RepID=UPI003A8E3755
MIDQLYQKAILQQAARASGHGRPAESESSYTLHNPLCGDRITVHLKMEGERLALFGHETRACVLCQANASLLAEKAPGETAESLTHIQDLLVQGLESGALKETDWPVEKWQELSIFAPVTEHKSRHKCVTLPFEALISAMRGETEGN